MNTPHTTDESVALEAIRALWRKTAPAAELFTEDGTWEIESYWRMTACSVGLRLTAISQILEKVEVDEKLRQHVKHLTKELELLNTIMNLLFDRLPRPRA